MLRPSLVPLRNKVCTEGSQVLSEPLSSWTALHALRLWMSKKSEGESSKALGASGAGFSNACSMSRCPRVRSAHASITLSLHCEVPYTAAGLQGGFLGPQGAHSEHTWESCHRELSQKGKAAHQWAGRWTQRPALLSPPACFLLWSLILGGQRKQ